MCRLIGFKSCTIMTFMILLKPLIWEKYDSPVKCKNAVNLSNLNFSISKTIGDM